MFGTNRGWALKDVRTGRLCTHIDHRGKSTPFFGSHTEAQESQRLRAGYGHQTVIVPVFKTWSGRVMEDA